jgi:hypothetical protein
MMFIFPFHYSWPNVSSSKHEIFLVFKIQLSTCQINPLFNQLQQDTLKTTLGAYFLAVQVNILYERNQMLYNSLIATQIDTHNLNNNQP